MGLPEGQRVGLKSRRKGAVGEQQVGRFLYQAWFGEEPARQREVFTRTKPGCRQREGDLQVPQDFPWLVSVKNQAGSPLTSPRWWRWWREAQGWSEDRLRWPLLVWRPAPGRWWAAWEGHGPYDVEQIDSGREAAFRCGTGGFSMARLEMFCKALQEIRQGSDGG